MVWTSERSTINQTLQFGLETTPGVNVAANKSIQCFAITFGPMAEVSEFSATGRKYPSIVIENSEWVEGTLTGSLDYNGDRKAGFTVGGKVLAQQLQRAITMTSTPTAVVIQPSAGKHFNIYLDPTSAALGTTQLLKVLDVNYAFTGLYGMFFPLNRANLGWTAHVDLNPGCTIKLLLEADAIGMTPLTSLQAGSTQFLRVQGQGAIIDNIQTLTFGGGVTGGTFTLSYKGQTTAPITYAVGLTAATINTAFQLLSTVSTNCTVTGSAGGPYTFTFSGGLASDMSPVTANNINLSGGTPTMTLVAQAY